MTTSLRKEMKDKRRKKRMQERRNAVLMVIGGIILLVALFTIPPLIERSKPIGEIISITPVARPNVNGTALGDPNAPVRIDVFEDFQCPACKSFTETTESQIIENYVATGKAYYVFREFPFIDDQSATRESDQAANASMCAADQGRFWDYHDMLFANWKGENIGTFSDRKLEAFAETLKLDMKAFRQCYKNNRFKDQIQKDLNDGQRMGVQGTPSVFVNGTLIAPGYIPTYEQLAQAIDAGLNK